MGVCPCLEWIRDNRAWFDLFYEHVNYFRLSDFFRIFKTVFESGRLFGDQYLYVVSDLSAMCAPAVDEFCEFQLPGDFLKNIDRAVALLKNNADRKYFLWGAASKGVIFALHLLRRGGVRPDAAIDINPAKQGKYLPVTGLPVLSPDEGLSRLRCGDAIFVMNSNYFEEIKLLAGDDVTYYKVDQDDF